jgi:hypothetical protein
VLFLHIDNIYLPFIVKGRGLQGIEGFSGLLQCMRHAADRIAMSLTLKITDVSPEAVRKSVFYRRELELHSSTLDNKEIVYIDRFGLL